MTGTRGKSSVVRLLASTLSENGTRVLAKTTGAEAKFILPDGSEIDVPRRGLPSIMEQKKLLRMAVKLHVECIVAEIMSIHPENHYVESQQLLKPNIVALTNVRLDHVAAMGITEDEIAAVFCLDFLRDAKIFMPQNEMRSLFLEMAEKNNVELIPAKQEDLSTLNIAGLKSGRTEFSENFDLAISIGKHLGIKADIIAGGIQTATQDLGGLKIWKYRSQDSGKIYYLVNAFAANDPQSTLVILNYLKNNIPFETENFIGLLNLRADRGDRTLQWIQALKNGAAQQFKKIFVTGAHKGLIKRKVNSVAILKDRLPVRIMETIFAGVEDQAVIFGFGNIGGNGRKLVHYWNQTGEIYGV